MKRIALLSIALLASPAVALAQQAPAMQPPGAAAPAGMPNRAAMMQMHQQFRNQVLGALTAQHRALLANVVGQLAISPNPDVQSAARQLDAALSPQESRNILNAEASMRAQMSAAMNGSNGAQQEPSHSASRAPDAGRTLLHAALGFGHMHAPGRQ